MNITIEASNQNHTKQFGTVNLKKYPPFILPAYQPSRRSSIAKWPPINPVLPESKPNFPPSFHPNILYKIILGAIIIVAFVWIVAMIILLKRKLQRRRDRLPPPCPPELPPPCPTELPNSATYFSTMDRSTQFVLSEQSEFTVVDLPPSLSTHQPSAPETESLQKYAEQPPSYIESQQQTLNVESLQRYAKQPPSYIESQQQTLNNMRRT